jgi:SAM-dependent methyltransferase
MRLSLYRLLEWPRLYQCVQHLLAPGVEKAITLKVNDMLPQLPRARRILDVGCGPQSRLWKVGLHPVGLDLSPAYAAYFKNHGEPVVSGSAVAVPFPDDSFDAVWCFALMHHLPDSTAGAVVDEMLRVSSPGGYVLIMDWVLPTPAWRHPLSWALQKFDRGQHARCNLALETLILSRGDWICDRVVCSPLRYEAVFCLHLQPVLDEL